MCWNNPKDFLSYTATLLCMIYMIFNRESNEDIMESNTEVFDSEKDDVVLNFLLEKIRYLLSENAAS